MKSIASLILFHAASIAASPYASPNAYASAYPQGSSGSACDPKNSPAGLGLGTGVPMVKADIPTGCSDFEILVGKCLDNDGTRICTDIKQLEVPRSAHETQPARHLENME
jgi:hypothetical protein